MPPQLDRNSVTEEVTSSKQSCGTHPSKTIPSPCQEKKFKSSIFKFPIPLKQRRDMLLLRFCLSFFFLSLCLTIFFCLFYLSVRLSSFSTYPLLSFPFPPRNNYPSPCVLVLAWFSTSEIHPPLWKAHQLWWPRSRESPNIVAEIAPCGKKGCFSCACVRCSVSVHE